jgi:hypothetical protein
MTGQNFTPTVPGTAVPASFVATIPSLEDDANIVTAFEDYHTSLSLYLNDSIKKTSASSQTISSELTLSGATTVSGATLSVSSATVTFSGSVTFSSSVSMNGSLTVPNGINADILAENGSTKILENGNASAILLTGAGNTLAATSYNAILYGTAAVARSAVLFSASATAGDYTNLTGFRRIFVGPNQPTAPGLQAGDIWMW